MTGRHMLMAAVIAAGLTPLSIHAQQTGGVVINGTVKNNTFVKQSSNIASGAGSKAKTSIGSISNGVRINGNLNMNVTTDTVTTAASGPGETAITSIGSVHPGAEASGSVTVSTGNVVNAPSGGGGKPGCVIIGSVGIIPECEE